MFYVLFLLLLLIPQTLFAAIRINEIYPAPATGSFEWIELYNADTVPIDLTQYIVEDIAGNKITLPSTIPGLGFISATSSGVLNNSGDTLLLKRGNETIDIATYSGTFTSQKSSARCPDGASLWEIVTLQTRDATNTPACPPSPTPTAEPTTSPTPTMIPTTSNPTPSLTPTPAIPVEDLMLSEIMTYPEGGDDEWVEIYNQGSTTIVLTNWYIDDGEKAGGQPRQFSVTIPPLSFATIDLDTPLFNNAGDTVRLLDETEREIVRMEYTQSKKGYSWVIPYGSNEYCMQLPTKGSPNDICIEIEEEVDENQSTTVYSPVLSPTLIPYTGPPIDSSQLTLRTYRFMFTNSQAILPTEAPVAQPEKREPLVLGAHTEKNEQQVPLHERLSIASFSLAFIAGLSIFLKSTR